MENKNHFFEPFDEYQGEGLEKDRLVTRRLRKNHLTKDDTLHDNYIPLGNGSFYSDEHYGEILEKRSWKEL